ncbi:MAG TPA: response regulator [Sulfurimonas autotrophica]|uniref:Response regulator n=1 Tax=Sulfurimonas autotrophica TaxID=202747 RepID=A0A7C3FY81_9BACT|nr:response regulator [Sulfurimonas autotrophica]
MQKKFDILVVDDVSENIKIAIGILKSENYNFSYALSGKSAIEILKTKRFDLILLDVMMPEIDGFTLCKMIKKTPALKDIPIIFVTAVAEIEYMQEGFKLGAVDYVTKPYHSVELRARVANHLELYRYRKELKYHNKELVRDIKHERDQHLSELELAQKEIIYILSEIMASDSGETAEHVKRVANISKELAVLDGNLSHEQIHTIYLASPLHDIGKVVIDNSILHKNAKLTDEEFAVMKKHPTYALNILSKSKSELIKAAAVIAYEHHENWDGSGYPKGLKGDDIHIYGRIVAIADVLDALTHKRSYKEKWSFEEASRYIIERSGTKFDPRLVSLFKNNLEVFKELVEEE